MSSNSVSCDYILPKNGSSVNVGPAFFAPIASDTTALMATFFSGIVGTLTFTAYVTSTFDETVLFMPIGKYTFECDGNDLGITIPTLGARYPHLSDGNLFCPILITSTGNKAGTCTVGSPFDPSAIDIYLFPDFEGNQFGNGENHAIADIMMRFKTNVIVT